MNEKQCLQLLRKHAVPRNIVLHVRKVAQVAVFLARRMKKNGVALDLSLVRSGALLHDIGKFRSIQEGAQEHEVSKAILDAEGLFREGMIAHRHMLSRIVAENPAAWSLEERLVYYADKRVAHHSLVFLDERILDLMERYPAHKKKVLACAPALHALEAELLALARVSPALEGLA